MAEKELEDNERAHPGGNVGKVDHGQKGISRRSFLGGGAARAVAGSGAAEADPLIAEAEHIGQSMHFLSGGPLVPGVLRKALAAHPELSKYAEHAIRAYHQAEKLSSGRHGDVIRKLILGN